MKLALTIGPGETHFSVPIPLIQHAEALGFSDVTSAETFGADCMTPLAFIAAHTKKIRLTTSIAQLDARTPANLAMCALTIEALAGKGRMALGIGVSGPQIVEGWYGRPWGKPNLRIRDTVAICRKIFRHEVLTHEGKEISLPYTGEGAIGLGKSIQPAIQGSNIPILLGTSTPLNIRMAGEIGDGWLGFHLVPSTVKKRLALLEEGLSRRTDGKTLKDFEIHAMVGVALTEDVKAGLQRPKPHIAYFAGGMGAKSMNFHKEAMVERGYGEAAERVQELFLAGRRDEAAAAVPDEYVDEEWLVGPAARIMERFKPWQDSGITTLRIRKSPPEVLELLAKMAFG
jgi:F420-dependent oxidoreductase-like protein